MSTRNMAASVRARLLGHARESKQDFNFVLTRYAIERLLYRIGISKHAEHFLLKGALLFDLWLDLPHRPTRDVDLLGFGPSDLPFIEDTFREICLIDAPDGMEFQPNTVSATNIRKEAHYPGVHVALLGFPSYKSISVSAMP